MEKEYICLYKRKLDDIEVTNGIQNLLSDFKNKLSEYFTNGVFPISSKIFSYTFISVFPILLI